MIFSYYLVRKFVMLLQRVATRVVPSKWFLRAYLILALLSCIYVYCHDGITTPLKIMSYTYLIVSAIVIVSLRARVESMFRAFVDLFFAPLLFIAALLIVIIVMGHAGTLTDIPHLAVYFLAGIPLTTVLLFILPRHYTYWVNKTNTSAEKAEELSKEKVENNQVFSNYQTALDWTEFFYWTVLSVFGFLYVDGSMFSQEGKYDENIAFVVKMTIIPYMVQTRLCKAYVNSLLKKYK